MSLYEDAIYGGFGRGARPVAMKKVIMPDAPLFDAAFAHYSDHATLVGEYIARQHLLYRLAEELTLLTVAARFTWVMRLAWQRGYQGPWPIARTLMERVSGR